MNPIRTEPNDLKRVELLFKDNVVAAAAFQAFLSVERDAALLEAQQLSITSLLEGDTSMGKSAVRAYGAYEAYEKLRLFVAKHSK